MTALPETGRPSISRWRPRRLTAAAAKRFAAVEKPLRRFLDLSRVRRLEPLGGIEASRPSGASATRARSPSIVGSASGRSQEIRICGSLRSIMADRSSLALVRASSVSSSLARRTQLLRPISTKDGGPGKQGEHHQRDQGEARHIGLDRRQAQKKRRRLFEDFKTTFRARRGGRQEDDRRRPYGRARPNVRARPADRVNTRALNPRNA